MKTKRHEITHLTITCAACRLRLSKSAALACLLVALGVGREALRAEPIAPLTIPHNSGGQAAVGGKLYVWAGSTAAVRTNSLEIYDTASGAWSAGAPMPSARNGLVAFALNNYLYSVSGEGPSGGTFTSSVFRYDTTADVWTTLNNFPQPGWGKMAAVVNGTAYVFGGRHGYGQTYGEVYQYNPTNDSWAAMAPMPVPLRNSAVAVYKGKVYVFGGTFQPYEGLSIATNLVQVFDPVGNSWTTQTMPVTFGLGEAATLGDYAYIFVNSVWGTNLWRYHYDTGQWGQQPFTPAYTDQYVNGTASVIGGWAYFANVLANGATSTLAFKVNLDMLLDITPGITTQPQGQIGYWGRSATLTVGVDDDSPFSYQWRKNGTNITGATSATLTLNNLQTSDAGAYDVVVSNFFGSVTSAQALVTFRPAPISIAFYAGVSIDGIVGRTYQVQYTTDLSQTNGWVVATNVTLLTDPQVWIDLKSASQPQRFYRVTIP